MHEILQKCTLLKSTVGLAGVPFDQGVNGFDPELFRTSHQDTQVLIEASEFRKIWYILAKNL